MSHNFPKTVNGNNCIGPCYQPGEIAVHPNVVINAKSDEFSICPIQPKYSHIDKKPIYFEKCLYPSDDIDYDKKYMSNISVIPKITFNCDYILGYLYDIHNLADAFEYCYSKSHLPVRTRYRIINCAFTAFNTEPIDVEHIASYLKHLINTDWKNVFLKEIGGFIKIDDDNVMTFTNSNIYKNDDNDDVLKYISTKIITEQLLLKFLQKFKNKYFDSWNNISDFVSLLKNDLIQYILIKYNII